MKLSSLWNLYQVSMITKLYSLETDSYYKFLKHVIYHNSILSPLMTYHRNINKGSTTVAPVVQDLLTLPVHLPCSRIPLVQYLVFSIVFFRLLFVFLSLFFWPLRYLTFFDLWLLIITLWHLQTFLTKDKQFYLLLTLYLHSPASIININNKPATTPTATTHGLKSHFGLSTGQSHA